MGFSVSGATALLFIAFLISFGAFYTASSGALDQVQEAQVDQTERNIETLNTEIEIDSNRSSYNESGNNDLRVVANNTGASSLQVADLSLLVNGEYVDFDAEADANLTDPSGDTLWIPQQTLTITITGDYERPVSIKLVTGYGIAAMEEVG
jgi:flagellar protein FlaF